MTKRYCQTCKQETLHDKVNDNVAGNSIVGRIFFGICSAGLSEMITDNWWKCQCCDRKTKI